MLVGGGKPTCLEAHEVARSRARKPQKITRLAESRKKTTPRDPKYRSRVEDQGQHRDLKSGSSEVTLGRCCTSFLGASPSLTFTFLLQQATMSELRRESMAPFTLPSPWTPAPLCCTQERFSPVAGETRGPGISLAASPALSACGKTTRMKQNEKNVNRSGRPLRRMPRRKSRAKGGRGRPGIAI
ncbi:hypothetical protein E2C01_003102 [Portunus trituberculatus]|uniref:Uncharacterized protein n=1 Tax=Portunus trituberculatus TaxID=210409 RepID=A0A5B7CMT3_PORTR|nr:hypothetical protein [Portunus trituberculatus]